MRHQQAAARQQRDEQRGKEQPGQQQQQPNQGGQPLHGGNRLPPGWKFAYPDLPGAQPGNGDALELDRIDLRIIQQLENPPEYRLERRGGRIGPGDVKVL
jgi:hypothetical protein